MNFRRGDTVIHQRGDTNLLSKVQGVYVQWRNRSTHVRVRMQATRTSQPLNYLQAGNLVAISLATRAIAICTQGT